MKKPFLFLLVFLTTFFYSCEKEVEPVKCFPQRITHKQTTETITSDYKYEEESVARVVMSNYQTHYYFYDTGKRLNAVERKNVQTFVKQQSRLIYENDLLIGTDEYLIRLDKFTQDDIDTAYSGYREFEYEGERVVVEKIYEPDGDNQLQLVELKNYEYDLSGNIVKYVSLDDFEGDTIEAFSYTYDQQRHPFSSMDLLFEGKSYINNILSHTDLLSGDFYAYQIVYTPTKFPSQIIIRENSDFISEIITIDYACK
jgi:hypothetical protein